MDKELLWYKTEIEKRYEMSEMRDYVFYRPDQNHFEYQNLFSRDEEEKGALGYSEIDTGFNRKNFDETDYSELMRKHARLPKQAV